MTREQERRPEPVGAAATLLLGMTVALLIGMGFASPKVRAALRIQTARESLPMQSFESSPADPAPSEADRSVDPLERLIDLHDLAASRQRLEEAQVEAPRETVHETRALLARLRAAAGDFEAAQKELDALKEDLDGDSRVAAVRYFLERGRAHARAEDRTATRAFVEDAWYLAREIDRGDLEFEAALLTAWSSDVNEKALWKERMREALEESPEARALAEWRKTQLTNFVATDEYAVMVCLALR